MEEKGPEIKSLCLSQKVIGVCLKHFLELLFGSEKLMPMKAGNRHVCNRLPDEKRYELHLVQSTQPVITVLCLEHYNRVKR